MGGGEPLAGPGDAGSERVGGDAEDVGSLVVGQPIPGDQEQGFPILGGESPQRAEHLLASEDFVLGTGGVDPGMESDGIDECPLPSLAAPQCAETVPSRP